MYSISYTVKESIFFLLYLLVVFWKQMSVKDFPILPNTIVFRFSSIYTFCDFRNKKCFKKT